ncbi:hypothetical protein ACOCJ7_09505 [Knoellia sp. CPCC 206453]|uniref:hypothetical protein n=1 Tax=Knoellia pratensis TaxID=3404796 RepID=UPI00361FDBFC
MAEPSVGEHLTVLLDTGDRELGKLGRARARPRFVSTQDAQRIWEISQELTGTTFPTA